MHRSPLIALAVLTIAFFPGCLVNEVGSSGGMGSVTVPNTNAAAIVQAAEDIFPDYGYSEGPSNYPNSISFDKPAGGFGELMYGSYDDPTTMRVKLTMTPIPGTNDIRISPAVFSVSDAGQAGFEDPTRRTQLYALEFKPILQRIKTAAANDGPM